MRVKVFYLDWEGAEARGRGTPGYDRFYELMSGSRPPVRGDLRDFYVLKASRDVDVDATVNPPEAICESVWAALQDGGCKNWGFRARSMSVGDVLLLNGEMWAAANCGFVKVV